MALDLTRQLKQVKEVEAEINRALELPALVQGLVVDIDQMIGQMQRIRYNLEATLTDFKTESKIQTSAKLDKVLYDSLATKDK